MRGQRIDAGKVDAGRVVVTVLFCILMLLAAGHGVRAVLGGAVLGGQAVLEVASSVLTFAFCLLVVVAYLRRGPASATDRAAGVRLAAPVATCLPFLVPALPTTIGSPLRSLVAFAFILCGTAWSIWAVRHLSTNLSVVPQARRLVDSGPYRLVRHPLYLGEVVAVTGFALRGGHWSAGAVVVALLCLQLYRASREESLLRATVPGYAQYAARTWRIVPGLA